MNTFEFDRGERQALRILRELTDKNGREGLPSCLTSSDQHRLTALENTMGDESIFGPVSHLLPSFTDTLTPKWKSIYANAQAGQFNKRISKALLTLSALEGQSVHSPPSFHTYAKEIAAHEIAAFARDENNRMKLRLKKNIPKACFPIWERGLVQNTSVELTRFFRDAYLNLAELGIEHMGIYLVVFSKITDSAAAFQLYLDELEPEQKTIFSHYRHTASKSSRKHLAPYIHQRIIDIIENVEKGKA